MLIGERQGDVVSAETEGVVEGGKIAVSKVRRLGGDPHRQPLLEMLGVDRAGNLVAQQRHDRREGLQGSRSAEQMTSHRLGAGDEDVLGCRAQGLADRHGLRRVALRRRGGMGIDVLDVAGLQICRCQGLAHCRGLTVPGRIGLDDVVGIGRNARASQGAIDRGAAGLGMLKGLQHEDGRALTEDEAVAVHVPGTGCVFRVVIARRQRLHLGEGGQW